MSPLPLATVHRHHLGGLYVPLGHSLDLETGEESVVLRHVQTGKLHTVSPEGFTGRVARPDGSSWPCFWPDCGTDEPPADLVQCPEKPAGGE